MKRGTGAAFDPATISGLVLWLKADSLALNDADPVATWNDSSGLAHNVTQAVAGAKPTFRTNIINGKPVVRFDQVDDYMTTASFGLAQPYTVFITTKYNQARTANDTLFDGLNTDNHGRVYRSAALTVRTIAGTLGPEITTTPQSFHTYGVVFNGASSALSADGGTAAVANAGATSPDSITLNMTGGLLEPGGQDMAELLIYNSVLSAGNFTSVIGYLRSKYATP